jgi:hypothetical protein
MLNVPYISPQEFVDTFPDVDASRYIPTGTQPNQAQPLLALLRRASSLADRWCKQLLRATVDTETVSLYPTKDGSIRIWPKYRPIVSLTNLQYRYNPEGGWTVISPLNASGGLEQYENYFDYSGQYFPQPYKLTVQYTYVNGFPVTTIQGTLAQGATSITVANSIGIVQGSVLTIYDGANSEDVTVDSVNGNVLTLAFPTVNAHMTSGLFISGMPNAIAQATGMIAANMLLRDTDGVIQTGDEDFKKQYMSDSFITSDIQTLLKPFQINR